MQFRLRLWQLLGGNACSHVDILLYFLHSYRLIELLLQRLVALFSGLLVLQLLNRFCALAFIFTPLLTDHPFRSLRLRRSIVRLIFEILHFRDLHFWLLFRFLRIGDVRDDLPIRAQRPPFRIILVLTQLLGQFRHRGIRYLLRRSLGLFRFLHLLIIL